MKKDVIIEQDFKFKLHQVFSWKRTPWIVSAHGAGIALLGEVPGTTWEEGNDENLNLKCEFPKKTISW